jgi:hypothetical protein
MTPDEEATFIALWQTNLWPITQILDENHSPERPR